MIGDPSAILIYKYHIDLNITIRKNVNGHEATIQVSGIPPQIFQIGLTQKAIDGLNISLRNAIEIVRVNTDENNGVDCELLIQLANAGQNAFNRIFKEGKSILY